MIPEPILEVRCHPAQFMALKAASLVWDASITRFYATSPDAPGFDPDAPKPEPEWRTAVGQKVTISRYLPEEGLFLPGSKAAIQAEKTEAGDARRREALKKYRENFPS